MKRKTWLGCRAVTAIAMCIVLTITVAAAAAPTVWETLTAHLGRFSPYAQIVEGAADTDQGIELQVLSTLSDDLKAQVYFALRDVEADRLNEFLSLTGRLDAGDGHRAEEKDPSVTLRYGFPYTNCFQLVSYDPETKTALFSAKISYGEDARPAHEAQLSITGMTTRQGKMYADEVNIPCASVTGAALKSLPVTEADTVIFSSDESILPGQKVVLAPGQTPMAIEGTEDMRISSMGFASDGRFHIRLEFAEGVMPTIYESASGVCGPDGAAKKTYDTGFFCNLRAGDGEPIHEIRETLVEGGMDIMFPLLTAKDLETIRGCKAGFYGSCSRPGTDIEGDWSVRFQLEYSPSTTLDWTGELAGRKVRQVTVSPLSVTMYSNDTGKFSQTPLYAVKKDGSAVVAEPGTGRYSNLEAAGGKGCDAFNTWKFEEPVTVEDIVSLVMGDEMIPVN